MIRQMLCSIFGHKSGVPICMIRAYGGGVGNAYQCPRCRAAWPAYAGKVLDENARFSMPLPDDGIAKL